VSSSSPGLAKVSCYGVYFYNQGQVKIYPYERANSESTVAVLKQIRHELPHQPLTLLWDGVSYHRSQLVRQTLEQLQFELQPLPSYSPDFMPVEHLWAWLREEVTYHTCYDTQSQLITQIAKFQQTINANPTHIADRLWTKTQLDSTEEKLRFSK
jgi:transposase